MYSVKVNEAVAFTWILVKLALKEGAATGVYDHMSQTRLLLSAHMTSFRSEYELRCASSTAERLPVDRNHAHASCNHGCNSRFEWRRTNPWRIHDFDPYAFQPFSSSPCQQKPKSLFAVCTLLNMEFLRPNPNYPRYLKNHREHTYIAYTYMYFAYSLPPRCDPSRTHFPQ